MSHSAAAEIGGEAGRERGVDDQFAGAVIGTNFESYAVGGAHDEASFHGLLPVSDLLVDAWSFQAHVAVFGLYAESSVAQFEFVRPIKLELDLVRIASRSHLEVVFEPPLVAVENQVDSGIDLLVADAGELGNISAPLAGIIADKIVGFAGQGSAAATAARGLAPASFMRSD